MPSFAFPLQRVLDYRRLEEGWAKDALRLAREIREEAEALIAAIHGRRRKATEVPVPTLNSRLDLEVYLNRLDFEEAEAQQQLALRTEAEDQASEVWQAARAAAEAIEKLREKALEEWKAEEARREQADLDEWAVLRR